MTPADGSNMLIALIMSNYGLSAPTEKSRDIIGQPPQLHGLNWEGLLLIPMTRRYGSGEGLPIPIMET